MRRSAGRRGYLEIVKVPKQDFRRCAMNPRSTLMA
ncbi:hypothetical protein J2S57_001535 [Kineosporia succinea]|uniref:Uncharacterized protein n=1 Tax=Kineosporia succinea TaxID=84632 RepID=A0ABT9NZC5_9ACTN|nr:hypothetical protein [Kineosporia succinea]